MNTTFIRRLKYYGIGLALGLLIVIFTMPNRGCSWTPENRIKNMILGRIVTVNDVEWELMQSKGLTKEDIISVLNDGDVKIKESDKDGESKVYAIEKDIKGKGSYTFYFTLPFESYISEVNIGEINAKKVKNTKVGYGKFLSFPNDPYIVYPDSTKQVNCQMETLKVGDVKTIYKDIQVNGRINFSKSNLDTRPKPQHEIEYFKNNDTISFQSVWYKDKIYISNFTSAKSLNCKD